MALTKISTGVIAANTLATSNIADNSVDATKIASNSILTRHIDDDQITGDQLADNITIAGNLTVTGNLTTNGSSVTNSSTNTTIEDALIELGTGTSGSPSTDAGIVIERGTSDNVFIGWDESADKVMVGTGSFTGASSGNLTITAAPFVSGALTASGISYPTSDGSAGQYLKTDGSGTLTFDAVTTQVDNYTATGNGSTTAFDTGINPQNEVNTWIFIDGVYQQKSQYSYSGSTVTFSTAPENGALIDVVTGTTSGMASSDTVLGIYEATTTDTATYSTGISASNENNTWVFVGGVYQPKDSYTFSSGTLTFDANTPTGQKLSVVATKALTAGSVETSSLGANIVTAAKIASNAILSRHIANNSIVGADISATTQITANTFTGALTGNVTGNVAGNLTGTILTAAQTNITSVGTLSALTVSGQLTAGGLAYPTSDGSNGQVLKTDGSGALSFGTISGTTINNNTNNYVITGTGTSNTLNGESTLTYDGSALGIAGGSTNGVVIQQGGVKIKNGGTQSYVDFYCESNNAHYSRLQAPAHADFSGNITATLPNTTGTLALTSEVPTFKEGGTNFANSIMIGDNTTGTLSSASYNVGLGVDMLHSLTSGAANIAIGFECLKATTSGGNNVAVGHAVMYLNTTGEENTGIGSSALQNNSTGTKNTAVGREALKVNTTASNMTAVGMSALKLNTTGSDSTAIGYRCGYSQTTGAGNTYLGTDCGYSNQTGNNNVAIGKSALFVNTGTENCATGLLSGRYQTGANYNTFYGSRSGYAATSSQNTIIGAYGGSNLTSGANSTIVGYNCQPNSATTDREIIIGHAITGIGSGYITLGTSSNGRTYNQMGSSSWSGTSDLRLKTDIVEEPLGLSFINDLRPVKFKWKKKKDVDSSVFPEIHEEDSEERVQPIEHGIDKHGFIAQELESTLAKYSDAGDKGHEIFQQTSDGTYTASPTALIPMLVKAMQEQQTIIDDLKSRIETLEE